MQFPGLLLRLILGLEEDVQLEVLESDYSEYLKSACGQRDSCIVNAFEGVPQGSERCNSEFGGNGWASFKFPFKGRILMAIGR